MNFLMLEKRLVLEFYMIMVRKKKERLLSCPKIFSLCLTLDPDHTASSNNCMLFILVNVV